MNSIVKNYVVDPLERAGSTFLQQFVVFLSVSATGTILLSQNWLGAVDSAGFAAAISLATSVLTFYIPKLPALPDLILRVAKTFLQSYVGVLLASNVVSVIHTDWKGALAIAVPVAMTALLKGLVSLALPFTDGASLLPTSLDASTSSAAGYPDYPNVVNYYTQAGPPVTQITFDPNAVPLPYSGDASRLSGSWNSEA